jgi:hypothetical protein
VSVSECECESESVSECESECVSRLQLLRCIIQNGITK